MDEIPEPGPLGPRGPSGSRAPPGARGAPGAQTPLGIPYKRKIESAALLGVINFQSGLLKTSM